MIVGRRWKMDMPPFWPDHFVELVARPIHPGIRVNRMRLAHVGGQLDQADTRRVGVTVRSHLAPAVEDVDIVAEAIQMAHPNPDHGLLQARRYGARPGRPRAGRVGAGVQFGNHPRLNVDIVLDHDQIPRVRPDRHEANRVVFLAIAGKEARRIGASSILDRRPGQSAFHLALAGRIGAKH